jgi:hypothetical protein
MIRSFIAFLSGSLCYAALLLRVEMPNGRYRGQNPTAARAALMILSERSWDKDRRKRRIFR